MNFKHATIKFKGENKDDIKKLFIKNSKANECQVNKIYTTSFIDNVTSIIDHNFGEVNLRIYERGHAWFQGDNIPRKLFRKNSAHFEIYSEGKANYSFGAWGSHHDISVEVSEKKVSIKTASGVIKDAKIKKALIKTEEILNDYLNLDWYDFDNKYEPR